MNPQIHPEALDVWIDRATRGLAAESSEKVRTEILEHFESSREAQLSRGVQPAEAVRIALAELGSARKANRQYRKTLLTEREERYLKAMRSQFPPKRMLLGRILTAILLIEGLISMGFISLRIPGIIWLCLIPVLVGLVSRVLPIDTPRRGRIFRHVRSALFVVATLVAYWVGMRQWWLLLGAMPVLFAMDYFHASIRRKLPRNEWPKPLNL